MTVNTCVSCGMPLRTADDHALGDRSKPFCRHCATAEGTLKSYDEVLTGLIAFLQRTQGIDDMAARGIATTMLSSRPAWSKR